MAANVCSMCGKVPPVYDRLCAGCFDLSLPDDKRVTRAKSLQMKPPSMLSPEQRAALRSRHARDVDSAGS